MLAKLIRHWPVLAIAFAALIATSAASASAPPNYCDPLGGCKTNNLKISPSTVNPGKGVGLHGSTHKQCKVTIYSGAFTGATKHRFHGVPAVYVTANKKGTFSAKVTIQKNVKAGRYRIVSRCGKSNFGTATVKVT